MKIGIIINNILRDHISQLVKVYTRYTGNDPIEPIDPYNLDKSFPLEGAEDEVSSIQEFIHIDAPLEILGNAEETIKGIIQRLNVLQTDIEDEIILINRDSNRGRSATTFFLSKTNFALKKIYFTDSYEECWDYTDLLITDHPDIIACKPADKKLVKLNGQYNETLEADLVINSPEEIFSTVAEKFLTFKNKPIDTQIQGTDEINK